MQRKGTPAVTVGLPECGPMPVGIGTPDSTPTRLSRTMGFSTVHLDGATILRGMRSAHQVSGILAPTAITLGRAIVRHMVLRLASLDTLRILAETASLPVASEASTLVEVSAAVVVASMAAEVSTGEEAVAFTEEEDTAAAVDIVKRGKVS